MGLQADEITQEHKDEYLARIRAGEDPATAAREIGTTGTVMKHFRSRKSQWYDHKFRRAFDTAIESPERETAQLELLRGYQWEKAANGDSRMIEKLSYVHDPLWEPLRNPNLHVNHFVSGKVLHQLFPGLDDETLEKLIEAKERALERPSVKLLPPAASE